MNCYVSTAENTAWGAECTFEDEVYLSSLGAKELQANLPVGKATLSRWPESAIYFSGDRVHLPDCKLIFSSERI